MNDSIGSRRKSINEDEIRYYKKQLPAAQLTCLSWTLILASILGIGVCLFRIIFIMVYAENLTNLRKDSNMVLNLVMDFFRIIIWSIAGIMVFFVTTTPSPTLKLVTLTLASLVVSFFSGVSFIVESFMYIFAVILYSEDYDSKPFVIGATVGGFLLGAVTTCCSFVLAVYFGRVTFCRPDDLPLPSEEDVEKLRASERRRKRLKRRIAGAKRRKRRRTKRQTRHQNNGPDSDSTDIDYSDAPMEMKQKTNRKWFNTYAAKKHEKRRKKKRTVMRFTTSKNR